MIFLNKNQLKKIYTIIVFYTIVDVYVQFCLLTTIIQALSQFYYYNKSREK